MTAQELSEKVGYGLSRGVIANIESGRKTDITVDQLIALSTVLGIPPVALAIPVDEPYRFVRSTDAPSSRTASRAFRLMDWFQGEAGRTGDDGVENEASALAHATIEAVREYPKLIQNQAKALKLFEAGKMDEGEARTWEGELETHKRFLRQLGVDLKIFKIDE